MRHYMRLQSKPFEAIANGDKTFELRLYDEKRRKVKVGDEIEFSEFSGSGRKILTEVVGMHRFPDFKTLYQTLPLDKCGYAPDIVDFADPDDMKKYYSADEQKEYGVVGIEIKLIN